MFAKLTSKNQLTLPVKILEAVGRPSHFEVSVEEGRLILTPARMGGAAAVRSKLAALGITEQDIDAAVTWARS